MTFLSLDAVAWTAISAIATALAVVVALFKKELVRIWRRPRLAATIHLGPPDCHKTALVGRDPSGRVVSVECYYFRIWIENIGRQRAEKVQVFASRLLKKHADGVFREETSFLPMNLRWSHSQPVEIFAEGISPHMGRHCDLGHMTDPKDRHLVEPLIDESGQSMLALDLEVIPNTRSHLLRPGAYQLELKIAAANAAPVTKRFEITVRGDWNRKEEKMFSDRIGIKDVS